MNSNPPSEKQKTSSTIFEITEFQIIDYLCSRILQHHCHIMPDTIFLPPPVFTHELCLKKKRRQRIANNSCLGPLNRKSYDANSTWEEKINCSSQTLIQTNTSMDLSRTNRENVCVLICLCKQMFQISVLMNLAMAVTYWLTTGMLRVISVSQKMCDNVWVQYLLLG